MGRKDETCHSNGKLKVILHISLKLLLQAPLFLPTSGPRCSKCEQPPTSNHDQTTQTTNPWCLIIQRTAHEITDFSRSCSWTSAAPIVCSSSAWLRLSWRCWRCHRARWRRRRRRGGCAWRVTGEPWRRWGSAQNPVAVAILLYLKAAISGSMMWESFNDTAYIPVPISTTEWVALCPVWGLYPGNNQGFKMGLCPAFCTKSLGNSF